MQTNTEQLSNKSSLTLGFCLKILVHWHGWLDFACVKDTLYQVNTWNLNINDLLLFSFLIFVCLTGHVTKRSVSSTCLIDYTSRLINSAAQIILPIIFFCFAWFVFCLFAWPGYFYGFVDWDRSFEEKNKVYCFVLYCLWVAMRFLIIWCEYQAATT